MYDGGGAFGAFFFSAPRATRTRCRMQRDSGVAAVATVSSISDFSESHDLEKDVTILY